MSRQHPAKQLQALVFDLDDTLYLQADYKRSGFKAVGDWLELQHGIEQPKSQRILEQILLERGPSYPYIFNEFAQICLPDESLVDEMVAIFITHQPQINCFPGVIKLLIRLKSRYRLGLLTDGRTSSQKNKVEALGITGLFDCLLYSDSLGLSKPAPELYHYFEKKFCLSAEYLAYIGDNPRKDFSGANQRKWQTIRVLSGEFPHLQAYGDACPDTTLSDLTELEPWLEASDCRN